MTIVVDTLTPHSKSPPPCPIRRSPPPPPPPGHHNPSPLHPLTPGPSHSMTNKGLFKMLRILKERVVRWLVRELVPSCLVSRHSDSRHLSAGICQPASVSRHSLNWHSLNWHSLNWHSLNCQPALRVCYQPHCPFQSRHNLHLLNDAITNSSRS